MDPRRRFQAHQERRPHRDCLPQTVRPLACPPRLEIPLLVSLLVLAELLFLELLDWWPGESGDVRSTTRRMMGSWTTICRQLEVWRSLSEAVVLAVLILNAPPSSRLWRTTINLDKSMRRPTFKNLGCQMLSMTAETMFYHAAFRNLSYEIRLLL